MTLRNTAGYNLAPWCLFTKIATVCTADKLDHDCLDELQILITNIKIQTIFFALSQAYD